MLQHRRAAARVAAPLWGDGFARDGLHDLWAVRDWSLCSPDEYILLFPRLIPAAGDLPPVLRAHLEGCVRARASRLARLDGVAPALRSSAAATGTSEAAHRDRFAGRAGLPHIAPGRVAAERGLLSFLDGLLAGVQARRAPVWDEASEALLAFGSGIHPAYLWPEAAVSPARGITAGWLGHLDRGRRALMPLVVAEYVLDALDEGAGRDRLLLDLAGSAIDLDLLRRAARRRWSGRDATVRPSAGATAPGRRFSGWGRPAAEVRA